MVENIEKSLLSMLTSLTLKVTSQDLRNNLKKVERQSSFMSLSETEKVTFVLQFSDSQILDYQEELEKIKKFRNLPYPEWKGRMLAKFDSAMSKKEFLRCHQEKDESCYDYFVRMLKEGKKLLDDEEWILEISLMGLKRYKEEIEKEALRFKEISEEFLETIKGLEMIKKEAWIRRNQYKEKILTSATPKQKLKEVNNVEEAVEFIKDNSVYLRGYTFRLVVDTGSQFSFITKKVLERIKETSKRMKNPMKLYTCLLEEFWIEEEVELEFELGSIKYKENFKILPRRDDLVVILGRDWIVNRKASVKSIGSKTTGEALKRLNTPKKEGYKSMTCEIKSKPGLKVVDVPYKIPQFLEKKIDDEIVRLLNKGYIRESRSSWLNNVRPVEKKDGSVRLTTNLIKLNDIVELDSYSLPRMEELLCRLSNKKWFSKIDLKEGFFQIHLRETDKEKTAFRIKNKTYEWNRMPMGFKNSPAVFQRIMDKVLQEEIGKCCFVYIDDILVFGENEKEHDEAFIRICDKLSCSGFQSNADKVEFKKKEVIFLGHTITLNTIKAHIDPTQGFKDYKRPENVEEIRRFLGMVNYYRKFIKNCAHVSEPLSKLLRKDMIFEWTSKQENAFQELKKEILSGRCLTQPNFKKRFILTTDASNKGLGAILSQETEGIEYPIAFASRGLRPAEFNYSITEKEMLAALWAMEYFDFFLYGREFTVYTDHRALEAWSRKGMINSARIERWHERLGRYNCRMEYKKPESLEHADALSRAYTSVGLVENEDKKNRIIKIHEDIVHRGAKATYEAIKKRENNTDIALKDVYETLKKCYRCKLYNPIKVTGWRYIESFEPGEKVAFDIIGPIEDSYIITAIDYFSRFAMAEVIDSRKSENVIRFLQKVHFELSIKTLISDSARENDNSDVRDWASKHNVRQHITSPYHHNSNGRVERFNRTLGEAIKKQDKKLTLNERVKKAIQTYNTTVHSATGLTPVEALEVNNLSAVKQAHFNNRIEKYKKLFKEKPQDRFSLNDFVLIEDSIHKVKGQPKFGKIGEIVGILINDTYLVSDKKKTFKRHATQLRKIEEDDFFL